MEEPAPRLPQPVRPAPSWRPLLSACLLAAALQLPALAGSGAVRPGSGFRISPAPLEAGDAQYTDNEFRTFVVAGCVPINHRLRDRTPSPLTGSSWGPCNDLDVIKDKVEESPFVSCLDVRHQGVLDGLFIKEVSNRTWESFRFSCRELGDDGKLTGEREKAPFLFNFEKEGRLYSTTLTPGHLSVGLLEVHNRLQLRESLLQVGLEYASSDAILQAGRQGADPRAIGVTPRIPRATPLLPGIQSWRCPPGRVVTGAAIGHIPNARDKHTRPVYLLLECRKLLYG